MNAAESTPGLMLIDIMPVFRAYCWPREDDNMTSLTCRAEFRREERSRRQQYFGRDGAPSRHLNESRQPASRGAYYISGQLLYRRM